MEENIGLFLASDVLVDDYGGIEGFMSFMEQFGFAYKGHSFDGRTYGITATHKDFTDGFRQYGVWFKTVDGDPVFDKVV